MSFAKMSIKSVSNNINIANVYFLCYSDLDFLDMAVSFMLFTNMRIRRNIFHSLGEYFPYMHAWVFSMHV